jgi:hypothetical protein
VVVVSEFMIYYNLQNINLQNTKLFNDIANLILSLSPQQKVNKVLVIKIEEISDSIGDSPIPKLVYENT